MVGFCVCRLQPGLRQNRLQNPQPPAPGLVPAGSLQKPSSSWRGAGTHTSSVLGDVGVSGEGGAGGRQGVRDPGRHLPVSSSQEKAISIWESENFFFDLEPLPGAVEAVKQMANLER